MEDMFIHPTAVVDQGAVIGSGTKIWHFSHIMSGAVLGRQCNLGQNVFIASGVVIGNNVKIQNNVSLYTGVICEDDVFLGPSVVFTNVINPRSAVNRKGAYKQTIVGRGVSIGANATIVCGHKIGQYAFIGAGAVVTGEIPDFALVVGNPGRVVGFMSRMGHKLGFSEKGQAVCPESGEQYTLIDGKVSLIASKTKK
jgi:UDP-2-acetamido-3-amino-2,3-dideoxy-glucuronate N-acetyltransferase